MLTPARMTVTVRTKKSVDVDVGTQLTLKSVMDRQGFLAMMDAYRSLRGPMTKDEARSVCEGLVKRWKGPPDPEVEKVPRRKRKSRTLADDLGLP